MRRFASLIFSSLLLVISLNTLLHAQQAAVPAQPAKAPPVKLLSDHLNESLPRWLRFNGEYRVRLEGVGGVGFKPNANDAFVLGRLRLNMRILPTSWMRFQFQVQDSQAAFRNAKPDGPPYEDTMDLRAAYLELGNAETQKYALRVGRQELAFGEMRLVGHLNWTNTARTFDAVRATARHGKYKVDVFASSVVNVREGFVNKSSSGNPLYGAYGSMDKVVPKATIEPYFLWRLAHGAKTETGAAAKVDRRIAGVRWLGKLPSNLDYNVEMASQTGSVGTDTIRAWAGHWVIGETLVKVAHKPRVFAEYNFASGDKTPGDGKQALFDQLYPTGHDKLGLADQVGWKNIHDARTGIEIKPTAKLAMSGGYHSWWLASTHDGLYNASGALVAKVANGSAGRYVGGEADVQAVYTLNATAQFGGGFGNVFPGTFLKNATPGKPYHFSYAMVTYSF